MDSGADFDDDAGGIDEDDAGCVNPDNGFASFAAAAEESLKRSGSFRSASSEWATAVARVSLPSNFPRREASSA